MSGLSSLEAAEVRGELVDALARSRRVCPHLHLCLQSGSDANSGADETALSGVRFPRTLPPTAAVLDQPAFTTDVIVGFPGETNADFEATCRMLREVGFSKIHIFSFSPRKGTAAADLPGRIHPAVVNERRERLRELETELAGNYLRSLVGRRLEVLVEGADPQRPATSAERRAADSPVSFEGRPEALLRRLVPVSAVRITDGVLRGEPEPGIFGDVLQGKALGVFRCPRFSRSGLDRNIHERR